MRLRPFAAISLAALLVLPLAACSASSDSPSSEMGRMQFDASSSRDGNVSPVSDLSQTEAGAIPVGQEGQSVIRNGGIEITVANPGDAAKSVSGLVTELGGYVESETLRGSGGGSTDPADLTVRVPADRFDEAFEKFATIGEVQAQSRSAADVTAQHVDLQARIGALESSIDRLTELMSGAATTSDLLEAEAALSSRQQELDGLNAQLTALEDQVDLASIWVRLSTESVIPGGPGNFWDGLSAGWNSLVQALAGGVVIAGILLPWLVLLGALTLVVWIIARAARRRNRARTVAASVPGAKTQTSQDERGPHQPTSLH